MPSADASRAVPALEVIDLRKTYASGVEALKGVSLKVAQGDFFALLGPNGAGKSTLIGILSSLVNPTSGDARVFGLSIHADRGGVMRQIGLVHSARDRQAARGKVPEGTAHLGQGLPADPDDVGRHEAAPDDRARNDERAAPADPG
jgi:energy-coupling factor transporter ATP-binding protein EcfA2